MASRYRRKSVRENTPILEASSSANSSINSEIDQTEGQGEVESEIVSVRGSIESESQGALEPSVTDEQVSEDFETVIGKIDQLSSTKDKEKIRFVAAFFLPALASKDCHDSPSKICEKLQCQPEYNQEKALAIFGKILECSCLKIKERYVKAMTSHCPVDVPVPEKVLDELSSRKRLLEECSELEEKKELFQKFRNQFEDQDLGMSKDDITSHVILLQRLSVKPGALENVPSQLDEARYQLSAEETSVRSSQVTVLLDKDGETTFSVQNPPTVPLNGEEADVIDKTYGSVEGREGSQGSTGRSGTSRCCSRKSCVLISFLVLFLLLGISTGFSVHSGILSSQKHSQDIMLRRRTTALLAKERLNDQYYTSVNISLDFDPVNRPNVSLCQFDCTQTRPRVRTDLVTLSFTSQRQSTSHRRLVRLRTPIHKQMTCNYLYMLEGSSVLFTASNITHPVELHMVASNDLTFSNCYDFLHERSNSSYRHFELNETNRYTANFTIPPGMTDTYYCGVMVAPPSAIVNYSVNARVNVYDIDYYQQMSGVCVNPIPSSVFNPASYVINMQPSLRERYTCLLLTQQDDDSHVQARVNIISTLSNPVFGLLLASACFVFISIIVVILCTICYDRVRQKCRHT